MRYSANDLASSDRTGEQNVSMPPAAVDPALAAVLRRLREKLEVSQQTIASRAEITTGAYAKAETARANPTWTTIRAIAQALGVSMAELSRLVEAEERS